MSAPDTNLEKQERRHKPSMIALRLVIAFAVLALVGFVALQMLGSGDPIAEGLETGSAPSAAVD